VNALVISFPWSAAACHAILSDPEGLNEAIGRAEAAAVRQHFNDYANAHPNKLGGKRSRYWEQASDSTNYRLSPAGVDVVVSQPVGVALHYYGGTVVMKDKLLTIPAIPAAYGRSAGDFANLRPVRFGRKDDESAPLALVETPAGARDLDTGKKVRRKKGEQSDYDRRVFFWLVRQTVHLPNPDIIPTQEQMKSTGTEAVVQYLDQLKN